MNTETRIYVYFEMNKCRKLTARQTRRLTKKANKNHSEIEY